MKAERLRLKTFLENNIPFHDLKDAGFFGKDVRKTDYEKIAEKVCWFFGYKSIYEYQPLKRESKDEGYSVDYIDLISELRNLN